jgi:sodium/potassium-transporting ATPase subunit alpha
VRAEDLTLGDIIEIKSGDNIPADIRIIQANGLKVPKCVGTSQF